MNFIAKITSRKFIAAVIGAAVGTAMIFGVDEEMAVSVAGAILTLLSLVSYIVIEGKVDREALLGTTEAVQEASKEILGGGDK